MKFFVGQRVKLVRSLENNGKTGTIVSFDENRPGEKFINSDGYIFTLREYCNCTVHYDGNRIASLEHTDRLEPILGDSRTLVSWAECEWKPPHLRETVT